MCDLQGINIEGIATGTPSNLIWQKDAASFVGNLKAFNPKSDRIQKIYKNTRIDHRYLAVNLLTEETYQFSRQSGMIEQRMEMFEQYGLPLAEEVSKKALNFAKINTSDYKIEQKIGLIVFVTSTGFLAPGIDVQLIQTLGLSRDIARIPIHFMGCAAAMNGLRVACDYIKANPHKKALMVCLELSSINAVFAENLNDIIIHSIFGDGCAAVILGLRNEQVSLKTQPITIKSSFSYLPDNTQDGIVLGIKDNGITCKLSKHLPNYIENSISQIIGNALANHNLHKENIDLWAVHPGGTRILEKVQSSLQISEQQTIDSWEILRQYGNTLSCAILFVIERIMLRLQGESVPEYNSKMSLKQLNGIAFSFAPGVGVEGFLFEAFEAQESEERSSSSK